MNAAEQREIDLWPCWRCGVTAPFSEFYFIYWGDRDHLVPFCENCHELMQPLDAR